MEKDFDFWNIKKKHINSLQAFPQFSEREIWWCVLGLNIGSEEDGKGEDILRPVLIYRKFNKQIFYALPITSKIKENIFHANINSGEIKGSVILSQMRLLDAKRLSHLAGKLTTKEFNEVKEKLKKLLP